jgi:LL-diaminopimelate aminotransferase
LPNAPKFSGCASRVIRAAHCAPDSFWEEAIAWAKKWNVIIASDECYTELYFDENKKPRSILEFTKEGVVVFGSLSKRSNMTGYRIGWVAGDTEIVSAFKKVKTNIDSGVPTFIQDAACVALSDETHVAEMRKKYRARKEVLFDAFRSIGLPVREPEATFYLWQKVPEGMTGVDFAKKLLDPKIAVVVTPGGWISDEVRGENPGENFVRFALVPDLESTKIAAEKIREHFSSAS